MKPVRRLLDRIHPHFAKGGKLEKLYPLYEALDTFLYTPGEVTRGASHIRDGIDLKRMMIIVVVALIPCFFMAMWNTGYQANRAVHNRRVAEVLLRENVIEPAQVRDVMQASVGRPVPEVVAAMQLADRERIDAALDEAPPLSQISLDEIGYETNWQGAAYEGLGFEYAPDSFWANLIFGAIYFVPVFLVTNIVGGLWELVFAVVRGHDINEGFLVTGALFPLTLPPAIPLWQVALGISFGVVIGKEIFGGTGRNFLNPALVGRAFLFFAYPNWIVGEVWTGVDGFTAATPLGAVLATKVQAGQSSAEVFASAVDVSWMQTFLGDMQGSMGETSTLACLIGAAILIATGVGSWKIMASMLVSAFAFAAFLWGLGSETNAMFSMPPWWHLTLGGFAFGLVFMATDPVSASMTEVGKWWYGALIGVMTILIRVINPAFPEGVMLAILFANVFAPLIDYFVIQRNIKRRMARYAT